MLTRSPSKAAAPRYLDVSRSLRRTLNISAPGKPSVTTLASSDGHNIVAASSPLPSGLSARAVTMPVKAFMATRNIRAASDCATEAMPRTELALDSGISGPACHRYGHVVSGLSAQELGQSAAERV